PPDEIGGSVDVDDIASEIRKNSADLDDYPYPPSFFNDIKGPIDDAITRMEDVPDLFDAIDSDIGSSDAESIAQVKNSALEKLNPSIEHIDEGSGKLESDRKEFKVEDQEYIDDKEEEAEADNDAADDMLSDLADLAGEDEVYTDLEALVDKYNEFAESTDGEIDKIDLDGDASGSADSAMGIVDSIFSGIGNILVDA